LSVLAINWGYDEEYFVFGSLVMLTRLIVIFSLFCATNSGASEWLALHPLLPKGTQFSYLVVDANKKQPLTEHQKTILRTPASMQKLLTATAAKLQLGANFRYQTTLTGAPSKIKNRSYQGDLRLNFVGDPTLTRTDIKAMLSHLKQRGVHDIAGDFIVNDAHFNGYQWSNGQAWNDLGVCYTAPANAIVVNRNCVLGNLSVPSKTAKKARLFIPHHEPISITSNIDVVSKAQREMQFCDLELTRNSQNSYHLWGCMVPRDRAFPLAIAINDPFHYVSQIIESELKKLNITLQGKVRLESKYYHGKDNAILASYQSKKLDELLKMMMKKSDNLVADSLFKTIGASYFQQPGNFRNGAQAVIDILAEQGVDLENAYLADGSGLSRHNLMSAELFMRVLQFVYHNDKQLNLLSSFSLAGIDGTLRYHRGVRGQQFKGKILAKTGSMKGVANLLGVVKTAQGDRLFVLILNGYSEPKKDVMARSQHASKYLFEQAFFEKILASPQLQ